MVVMTEQDVLDALAGSGLADDVYLRVAFAIRSLHRRAELANVVVADVLAHEASVPSATVAAALDYASLYAVQNAA